MVDGGSYRSNASSWLACVIGDWGRYLHSSSYLVRHATSTAACTEDKTVLCGAYRTDKYALYRMLDGKTKKKRENITRVAVTHGTLILLLTSSADYIYHHNYYHIDIDIRSIRISADTITPPQ